MSEPTIAAAALAFEVVKSGVSTMSKGDIKYTGPSATIGVRAKNLAPKVRASLPKVPPLTKRIFEYQWIGELTRIEKVNVKLDCTVQYNGPEVEAIFQIPADGMRARMNNDVSITVGNPLALATKAMPAGWKKAGFLEYPVVRIPVSAFVDRVWPRDNKKVSFMLVISGLYGFGADGLKVRENLKEVWD
ncbi:MAG: hypothetical protein CMJ50_05970 [Planctomycetaceae bacterium]|jgi:hypothetical protein|nr:hypothetical protein [Planctomycetaceae bacterium]